MRRRDLLSSTVSDTASQDANADKSGPLIKELLVLKEFQVTEARIVPDDEKAIRKIVKEWCSSGEIDWIISTGGTGFGLRDRTPEASFRNTFVTSVVDHTLAYYNVCYAGHSSIT